MTTKKQEWARRRNFSLMQIRGMRAQILEMRNLFPVTIRSKLGLAEDFLEIAQKEIKKMKTYEDYLRIIKEEKSG